MGKALETYCAKKVIEARNGKRNYRLLYNLIAEMRQI